MSNNKQTAVEQFAIALYEKGLLIGNGDWMQDILEKFKEMENDQINDAYFQGFEDNVWDSLDDNFNLEYYKQTYGNDHIVDTNKMITK